MIVVLHLQSWSYTEGRVRVKEDIDDGGGAPLVFILTGTELLNPV